MMVKNGLAAGSKLLLDPMLLTLDSNAFGVTKSTKENHGQVSCMGKVFLCFLFFVFDQYFSGSKARKGALQIGFLCAPSCFFVTLAGLPDRSKP